MHQHCPGIHSWQKVQKLHDLLDLRRYEVILSQSTKQYALCPLIDFINHSSRVEVGSWKLVHPVRALWRWSLLHGGALPSLNPISFYGALGRQSQPFLVPCVQNEVSYDYFADAYSVTAGEAYKAGDQVFISYGDKQTNDSLMQVRTMQGGLAWLEAPLHLL